MYIEEQLAELTRVIQAGFDNLADILRSQARPTIALVPNTDASKEVKEAPVSITGMTVDTTVTPNGEDKPTQLTFDQVNALAQEAARQKSPPVIIDLIRQHGANRLAEMDQKHYPAFVAALEVLLRKGEAAL